MRTKNPVSYTHLDVYKRQVQSGMGCFMDVETQDCLNHLEKKLFHRKGADFMGIYEEFFHQHFFDENGAIDQYAFLKPDEEKNGNIFAFETGSVSYTHLDVYKRQGYGRFRFSTECSILKTRTSITIIRLPIW